MKAVHGSTDRSVSSLHTDSRAVKPGSCFIAIKGSDADGHSFINAAIEKGAVAIVAEQLPENMVAGITYIETEQSAAAAGIMAHNFYGTPSAFLHLVGVTGTNGKTTVATILFKLFTTLGYKCGLISTIENKIADVIIPSTHTTGCHIPECIIEKNV
ncbi:MAG: Mur ligase domain-containing protein [Ferruginibacter sp.]